MMPWDWALFFGFVTNIKLKLLNVSLRFRVSKTRYCQITSARLFSYSAEKTARPSSTLSREDLYRNMSIVCLINDISL